MKCHRRHRGRGRRAHPMCRPRGRAPCCCSQQLPVTSTTLALTQVRSSMKMTATKYVRMHRPLLTTAGWMEPDKQPTSKQHLKSRHLCQINVIVTSVACHLMFIEDRAVTVASASRSCSFDLIVRDANFLVFSSGPYQYKNQDAHN